MPDFLRDLATSIRTGVPINSALEQASKRMYGPLTRELEVMIAHMSWGMNFEEALKKASGYRIAISPIIGTSAVSGPTSTFLKVWGHVVSPLAIGELYHDVIDAFVIHETDEKYLDDFRGMGIIPILEDIYIHTKNDAVRLFKRIMDSK